MVLTKREKRKLIDIYKDLLKKESHLIFSNFEKVKANELLKLKAKIKEEGFLFKIVKKRLFKIALRKSKNPFWEKIEDFKSQLAVAFAWKDYLKLSKILYQFSKENENFKILGGIIEGKYLLPEEIIELAKIPPKEELLAKLSLSFSFLLFRLINTFKMNLKGLFFILYKLKNARGN